LSQVIDGDAALVDVSFIQRVDLWVGCSSSELAYSTLS
jgi:hypothetical protein